MKKYLPLLFPSLATLVILVLAYRWLTLNQQTAGQISPFAEGVEIKNLSVEQSRDVRIAPDLPTIDLQSNQQNIAGDIRYQVVDSKLHLSIFASLPNNSQQSYQVWFRDIEGANAQKAMLLQPGKGGYIGAAEVDTNILPFEILVTEPSVEKLADDLVLLHGVIETKE